jgi:YVTN family beta-propeller protein
MRDHGRAVAAGLRKPDEAGCRQCHDEAHGEPFDYAGAWEKIAHGKEPIHRTEAPRYKTPLSLALSPDARFLWVTCEASGTVIVVDVEQHRKVAEVPTGGQPTDVALSPDGRFAYVSNRLDDTVSVVDARERRVLHDLDVGDEPHGVLTDPAGRLLYVLNTSDGSISVMDTATRRETKRLTASRSPWSLSLSPDGRRALVTNALSRFVKFREPSLSEVTVLDLERGIVEDRIEVPGSNLLMGVDWHPGGDYGVITLNRTKNLVPMTRLLQGWTITNGLGVVWRDGRVDQVLLDQPDVSFPDPTDVAITPDGRLALVTSATTDRVAVVDLTRMIAMIRGASDHEREHILPNHIGKPTEFVIKHIPVGISPRGLLIAPDGRTAYVAEALDDSVAVIDMKSLAVTATIDLGGPAEITMARRGERLFHSARIAFHRQFSCHTCHPDGHVDGITYDIEPDGIGLGPVDNRSLRAVLDTAPFKWEGTNPTLRRQCGPRLAVFFTRVDPFTADELDALEYYIATIPRPPNRYRGLNEPLSDAQRRGKKLFERAWTNDGRPIPLERRCVGCHPPPLFTNHTVVKVGKRMWMDREENFDTPHLNNIYDSAPYLHNGIANTLEEIWTVYNPKDEHGVTNDMTKDQLNDLIEYIKTL